MAAPLTPGRSRATVPEDVAALDKGYQEKIVELLEAKEALALREAQLAKENGDLRTRERQKEQRIQDVEAEQERGATELAQRDATIVSLRERLELSAAKIRDGEDSVNSLIHDVDTLRAGQQELEQQRDGLDVALQAEQDRLREQEDELISLEGVRDAYAQLETQWDHMTKWVAELTGTKAATLTFDDMREVLRDMKPQPSHSRNSSHSSHHRHSYGDLSVARTRQASLQHELAAVDDDGASKMSTEIDLDDIPEGDGRSEAEETLTDGAFAQATEKIIAPAGDGNGSEEASGIEDIKQELEKTNEKLAASQGERDQLGNDNQTLKKLLDDANAALARAKSSADAVQSSTRAVATIGVQTERLPLQAAGVSSDTDKPTPQAPQTSSNKSVKQPSGNTHPRKSEVSTTRRLTAVQKNRIQLPWWLFILLALILMDLFLAFRPDGDNIRYIPNDPVMWLTGPRISRPGIGFGGPVWMDPYIMRLEAWLGVERSFYG